MSEKEFTNLQEALLLTFSQVVAYAIAFFIGTGVLMAVLESAKNFMGWLSRIVRKGGD